jgi:ParB-like chromosome segregation protein Spo0J
MKQDLPADLPGAIENCAQAVSVIGALPMDERVDAINAIRAMLHEISPFKTEPVDFVRWVKNPLVHANDYNPNSVAPPEMELLRLSISADGYTQPIVAMPDPDGRFEVIDGFHRHRVGKECADIQSRVHGYLPLVQIRDSQTDRSDRIASTIRHNRARGKHKVEAMSDIVIELKRRNWSDEKIARELGMDADEVLRLCQITGLAEAFKDQQFSAAWEIAHDSGAGGELLSDVIEGYEAKDDGRILHTWDKWECYRHGFYAERPPRGMTQDEGEAAYREFLSDLPRFEAALQVVTSEWKHSCEHYLTNDRMNRIAWLGQASVAQALGIPSGCRAGYQLLTDEQKYAADQMALKYLNRWLAAHDRPQVMRADALGRTEAELY